MWLLTIFQAQNKVQIRFVVHLTVICVTFGEDTIQKHRRQSSTAVAFEEKHQECKNWFKRLSVKIVKKLTRTIPICLAYHCGPCPNSNNVRTHSVPMGPRTNSVLVNPSATRHLATVFCMEITKLPTALNYKNANHSLTSSKSSRKLHDKMSRMRIFPVRSGSKKKKNFRTAVQT